MELLSLFQHVEMLLDKPSDDRLHSLRLAHVDMVLALHHGVLELGVVAVQGNHAVRFLLGEEVQRAFSSLDDQVGGGDVS